MRSILKSKKKKRHFGILETLRIQWRRKEFKSGGGTCPAQSAGNFF